MPPAIHQKITYSKFSFENDLELQVQFNKPHCDTRGFSSSYLSTSLKVVSTQNIFFKEITFYKVLLKEIFWGTHFGPSIHIQAATVMLPEPPSRSLIPPKSTLPPLPLKLMEKSLICWQKRGHSSLSERLAPPFQAISCKTKPCCILATFIFSCLTQFPSFFIGSNSYFLFIWVSFMTALVWFNIAQTKWHQCDQ